MKKTFIILGCLTLLLIIVGKLNGYFIVMHQDININTDKIKEVVIDELGKDKLEYKLLTNDKNLMKELVEDLKKVKTTNIKPMPKGEKGYSIGFDSVGVRNSFDYAFDYYPQSDVIVFQSGFDYPTPITSWQSSQVLKELIKKMNSSEISHGQ